MDVDILISLVFSKPPIWDKRDKKHSNRYVVDKCWKEISAAMNEDENKLRKKWKYLRDQFATEYGKIPAPRSGDKASTSYESKWPYYHSLMFMKDIVKPRICSGNLSKSLKRPSSSTSTEHSNSSYDTQNNSNIYQHDSNDPNDYEACDVQHNTSAHDVVDENSIDTNTSTTHDVVEENSIDTNSSTDFTTATNAVPRKKTTNTFNQSILDIERKKLEYLQQKVRKSEDEHLLFLKSLLPHIRKIPQERLLSFRNEIQRTVDMYAYQSQFPRLSPSTLPSCSPEQQSIQSSRHTQSHVTQSVTQPFHSPTITRHSLEPHANQSVAQPFHSPTISRHTPEPHANQSVAQPLHSPTITRHTPEPHANQSVAQPFHSPTITRHSLEPHANQSVAQPFHSPTISRHTPEPHANQSVAQPFHSPTISRHTPEPHANQSVAQPLHSPTITRHTPELHDTQTIRAPINIYLHTFADDLSELTDY